MESGGKVTQIFMGRCVLFMFRGSAPAKIDDKGRLKVPTAFRRVLEESYGRELFLTSVVGDSVHLYPLSVWEQFEQRLAGLPSTDRTKRRYLEAGCLLRSAGSARLPRAGRGVTATSRERRHDR